MAQPQSNIVTHYVVEVPSTSSDASPQQAYIPVTSVMSPGRMVAIQGSSTSAEGTVFHPHSPQHSQLRQQQFLQQQLQLHQQQQFEQQQVVTVINFEQCCTCCIMFEERKPGPIPQPDLNRILCTLLGVTPQDSTFFREYLPFCTNCMDLLRKFDKLRLELEFVKTRFATNVIETLTQVRVDIESCPLNKLKEQILNRWTSTGSNRKTSGQAAYSAATTGDLSWAAYNNIVNNSSSNVGSAEVPGGIQTGNETTTTNISTAGIIATETQLPAVIPAGNVVDTSMNHEDEVSNDDNYDHLRDAVDDDEDDSNVVQNNEEKGGVRVHVHTHVPGSNVVRVIVPPDNHHVAEQIPPQPVPSTSQNSGNVDSSLIEDHIKPKRIRKKVPRGIQRDLTPFICTNCGRIYESTSAFSAHAQVCTSDDLGMEKKCSICTEERQGIAEVFTSWKDYKSHVLECHPIVRLEVCQFCRLRFLPFGVKQHKCLQEYKSHLAEKPIFKCDLCERNYNFRANLVDHVRRCHTDQKYSCTMCGRTYGSPMLLKFHVERHTSVVTKFKCDICGVCLSSQYSLKEHMKRHRGEQPYVCNICDKKFSSRTIFNTHQMVHTKIKPHVCDVCGKGFKLKATMKRHKIRHQLLETKYTKKCPLCPTSLFRKIWILKRHMTQEHPGTQETKEILKKYENIDDSPQSVIQRPNVPRQGPGRRSVVALPTSYQNLMKNQTTVNKTTPTPDETKVVTENSSVQVGSEESPQYIVPEKEDSEAFKNLKKKPEHEPKPNSVVESLPTSSETSRKSLRLKDKDLPRYADLVMNKSTGKDSYVSKRQTKMK